MINEDPTSSPLPLDDIMHLHQILTGAANSSDYSFAAGTIDNVHFVAYAAGYNIVILSGDFQRIQVLLSGNETNQSLVTCIDCTFYTGKIVAGFGNQLCIYEPSSTSERSLHHQVNYRWALVESLTCSNEKISAIAWHPRGDQMIVVCDKDLQVWSYEADEVDSRQNRVNFELESSETSAKNSVPILRTWKPIWNYKSASPIKHVAYSNDGTLFATASENDRLVKIWSRSSDFSAMVSFSSIYLAHPRAVTYISWRKSSSFFAEGTVANCLLTCAEDNICRIWCETRSVDESSIYQSDPNSSNHQRKRQNECLDRTIQKLFKLRSNALIPSADLSSPSSYLEAAMPHTPASLISSNLYNDEENSVNPSINISSSHSSSSSSINPNSTLINPFSVHLAPLRFHLATTINPSQNDLIASTIPKNKECMFTLQWLNNKDLYTLFTLEQYLLELQKKSKGQFRSTSPTTNQFESEEPTDTQVDFVNIQEKRPTIHGRISLVDDSKYFLQLRTFLKKLIDEWKTSPDVLFSIHPLDGSLLLWVIDCLDQSSTHRSAVLTSNPCNPSLINYPMYPRQVQVSFSARKPEIFPLGDALSLQPHLLIFCHDLLFNQYLSLNQTTKEKQHLPMINMISKHSNGTLNLWSLTFHEEQKFQSLICVTHTARMCGHSFPIRHISCHPLVPLVLTSSYDNDQSIEGKKQRFDNSLILWSSEPIGPLTITGGITELTRIESIHPNAFRLLAWFPMVLPCLNHQLLRESPSLLFCAFDGFHLRVYQVVCNAKTLLTSQFSTSKSFQSIQPQSQNETTGQKLNIVSNQSTARPSCVISLATLAESESISTGAVLIHIFPANAIDDRTEQNSNCKIYYLVLLEKSPEQSRIHMWKISITYPDDDEMIGFTLDQDWCLQVQSWKVSDYILPLSPSAELQSADVAFGHLSSSTLCYSDSSASSPYLLSSTHSNGEIRFWTCQHQSSEKYQWMEWNGVTVDEETHAPLKVHGTLLAISNAYCGRLAVATYHRELHLGIYECESTGGTSFHCETLLPLTEFAHLDDKTPIHFDWASIENGAHLLAMSIGIRYVFIYAYAQNSQWTKLRTIELSSMHSNTFLDPHLSLKWVRGGLLLIGLNSELQVYSQWSSLKRQCHSVKPEPLIKPKRRVNTSSNLKKLSETNGKTENSSSSSSWLTLDSIDVLSLFHAARNAAPVLPQYHPTVLLELVRFGKYRRVKAILAHLTRCIVSSVHSVEGKVEMKLMRSRTFSISNNDENGPSIAEVEAMKFVEIETIPLLPLFALLDSDHETTNEILPSSTEINAENNFDQGQNDKYDDLFQRNSPSDLNRDVAFQFDEDQIEDAERKKQIELNKFRRELLSHRHWSPNFDSRMVDLLVDYFQRVRLANLTSVEQMYLLALADTLANTNNEPHLNQNFSGEKPSNTMDDCGLRFLIDVKRYNYLSRSVNPQHQNSLKHIISSASFAWAFHSECQEDLLAMLPCMMKNKPQWNELEIFGVGWWIRNKSIITRLFEKLGKTAFELHNDPLDAALYFLALKKKSLLYNLFKHVQDTKMQDFFKNDFTEDRWCKAAQKNAFVLLGKQRFEHAAAFFLLAGKVKDAIEVLINNLQDFQLALLIARLHHDEQTNFVDSLLQREILSKPQSDPFHRSMALWLLKDYQRSLTCLLEKERSEEEQESILIFYDYLKQHPLVIKAKQLKKEENPTEKIDQFAVERRVHFQTAYHYLKMGCPLLALEILSKLPANIIRMEETKKEPEEEKKSNGHAEAIDWSQPISTKNDDDELKLEWSDEEEKEEEKEEKKVEEEKPVVQQQFDTIGQYMKLICCLKIIVEEMATLATGFEVAGGQLRHHLACWLEQEIGIIRQLCNLNSPNSNEEVEHFDEPILSDLTDDDVFTPDAFSAADSSTSPSLIRTTNFESKMKRSIRRRRWLQANEHLLRTLLSFTSLHGMHGGGLASVRMELLLLMHELYRDRRTQLKNPIPFPTQVPLLIANLSGTLTVSNNAITYIRDLSQDLLRTMNTWLTVPKLTEHSVQIVAIRDLSIALSSCVYQSLCHTNENQTSERLAVETFLKSYLYRRESIRLHRRKSVGGLIEQEAPTTAPKDWPGMKVSTGFVKDHESNINKLRILLIEILIAVYMSLLIYALSTDDCNTLYRLLKRKWSTAESAVKLWYGVFGGGAKKPLAVKMTSNVAFSTSPDTKTDSAMASSVERRSTSSSLARKIVSSTGPTATKPSYNEVFIPPRASIVNYFMAKISTDKSTVMQDEDGAISDADDQDEEDDDENDETRNDEELSSKQKQKKIQDREHLDSMSYSWVLMRYTIVRLVYKRLWAFFPQIGIEKQELAGVSPLIQQFLQNLNIWQDSLRRTLESFNVPPENYLPLSSVNPLEDQTNVPPIHRYRTILDPNNTPFSKSLSALPAKRLWIYLVNDEQAQGIFIKYIFKRKLNIPSTPTVITPVVHKSESRALMEFQENSNNNNPSNSNAKIIYRDSDSIPAFCLNNSNYPTLLAAGLSREVIELDISTITCVNETNELSDDENELSPSLLPQAAAILNRDATNTRVQTLRMPTMGTYVPNVYLAPSNGMTVTNESQHVLTNRHAVKDCRKFAAHPILPKYLGGCADGSVYLFDWASNSPPRPVREAGKRVTKVDMNVEGNKFGVTDVDGNLSLHVLTNNRSTAYLRLTTHNKTTNDFTFLDSSTILATCGLSTDQQNVAIWDTLMPPTRANITSFTCHESGGGAGQCLVYSPTYQLLISGGKRGDIAIFDLRQRKRLANSQAHESHLKALCLDPLEKFYITGSTEGNIKIWRLHGCELIHCFYNEHSRRGFLHSQTSGVNHLYLTNQRYLFSSGADGTVSVRQINQFD